MVKVLDSSFDKAPVVIGVTGGSIFIRVQVSMMKRVNYMESDLSEMIELSTETYRSGGKAVAGALVAGALTGGIGLLAGAAFGGRRRKGGAFIFKLKDGNHVAFSTEDKRLIERIQTTIMRQEHGLNSQTRSATEIDRGE